MTVLATTKVAWLLAVYMVHLTSLFLFTANALDFNCPRMCNCYTHVSGLPQDMIVHRCSIIAIVPTTNFSVMSTDKTSGLVLDCLASSNGSKLRDYIFSSLGSFVAVTVRNCHFNYIPRHAFTGMDRLEDLKIYDARHLQFHQDAFVGIPQLENLAIINSGVELLPNLCNLQNLMSLNLTTNNIEQFDRTGLDCTDQPVLARLTHIDLTDNKLSNFQNFVPKSVPNLIQLLMSNNKLDQKGYNRFGDFPRLQWLDLNGNYYTRFPLDMLANCTGLTVLGLAENKVQDVPNGLFSSLSNLQLLELGHIGVGDQIWIELNRLTQITIIRLEYNNIQGFGFVPPALKNLIELDITGNNITILRPYVFSKLVNLQRLKLAQNKIHVINRNDFDGLHNLTELDLWGNVIKYIQPSSFVELISLRILNISNNDIDRLPIFNNLPRLYVVDARDNAIGNITDSLCDGSNIATINLIRNKIGHIGNHVFRRCYSLQFLHLSENEISSIETGSFKDTVMKVFLLHHNKIRHIANLMTDMKHLTVVDLSNNEIEGGIYSDFFPSAMQSLDLSANAISSVAFHTFIQMDDLRKVDLRMNEISTLSSGDISVSTRTVSPPAFYIFGNRLKCDCNLYWLKKMNESSRILPGMPLINDLNTIRCRWTYKKLFLLMYKVPTKDFLCQYKDKCVFPCPCCDYHHCDCRQSCPDSCDCYRSLNWDVFHYVMCDNRQLTSIPHSLPNLATEVHMDGNNLTTIGRHAFIGISHLKVLFLNHSGILTLHPRSFKGLTNLETLHLDHNQIIELQPELFLGLDKVSILHIEHNAISVLENNTFESLTSLSALYLDHNRLNILPENVIAGFASFFSLTLSDNPWYCNCDYIITFGNYLYEDVGIVTDIQQIECVSNDTYMFSNSQVISLSRQYKTCLNVTENFNITVQEVKGNEKRKSIVSLTVICVFVLLAVVVTGLAAWHRDFLKIWIFTRFGIRLSSTKLDDNGRLYDAFVSYSSKDEHIVLNEIIPRLENGNTRYKLCLHFRDFPIGAPIGHTIVDSIESSKRTIMLLSNNFLSSEWCQIEFQTAHHHVLRDRSDRLIIVLLQDLDQRKLDKDPQLKLYLKTRTYLKFDDPWFWEKLKFAMPEIKDNLDDEPPFERNGNVGAINPYAVVNVVDTAYEEPIRSRGNSRCHNLALHSGESDKMEVESLNSIDSSNIYEEIYPV